MAKKKYDVVKGRKAGEYAEAAAYGAQALSAGFKLAAAQTSYQSAMAENRFNDFLTDIEESNLEDSYSGRLKTMERAIALQAGELNAALASQGVDVGSGGTAAQLKGYAREQFNEDLDELKTQFVSQQMGIEVKRAQLAIGAAAARDEKEAAETAAAFDLIVGAAKTYASGGFG